MIKLDETALSKLHDKLCKQFVLMLDNPELANNPKVLDSIIKFLDNNDINCSPSNVMETEQRTKNLRDILGQMQNDLEVNVA